MISGTSVVGGAVCGSTTCFGIIQDLKVFMIVGWCGVWFGGWYGLFGADGAGVWDWLSSGFVMVLVILSSLS